MIDSLQPLPDESHEHYDHRFTQSLPSITIGDVLRSSTDVRYLKMVAAETFDPADQAEALTALEKARMLHIGTLAFFGGELDKTAEIEQLEDLLDQE